MKAAHRTRKQQVAARFVSVQLEIESPRPLGYVLEAFSGTEVVAFDFRESKRGFSVAFEYTGTGASNDPDAQIAVFCNVIENLKQHPRAIWDGAYRKTFNLGYEIDTAESHRRDHGERAAVGIECFRSELKPETVGRIAKLGASVLLSIYPAQPPDPEDERA